MTSERMPLDTVDDVVAAMRHVSAGKASRRPQGTPDGAFATDLVAARRHGRMVAVDVPGCRPVVFDLESPGMAIYLFAALTKVA